MSILTPQEQIGFHRQKGWKQLAYGGFFVLIAIAYYFWLGPWIENAPGGTRVNAIFLAFYELFGIEYGTFVFLGAGGLIALFSIKHFREAEKIKRSGI